MKFCPNCGHELEAGAKFCPACGAQLATDSQQVSAQTTTEQPRNATETTANQQERQNEQSDEGQPTAPVSEADQPQLGFVGSVQYVLKHAFEFNGDVPESRKSVFWWAVLAVLLFDCVALLIPGIGWILGWAADLLLVSATMRRLTYLGQNPNLGWLMVVPVIYAWPVVLMFLDKKAE